MLIGIVQKDDVHVLCLLVVCQAVYSVSAVLVHSHVDVRIFMLHLEGLVPNLPHLRVFVCEQISAAFTFVSA